MPILILACLSAALVAYLVLAPQLTAWRRDRWRARPFPKAWRAILRKRVPYLRQLPTDLQLQLKQHMQVFLAEKAFIGCAGMKITDEVRVTIAAQACLLLLNRPTAYFPKLRQVLVYPGAFVVNRPVTDGAGVQQEHRRALSGESWTQGQVILSWQDTLEGAAVVDDGRNVVLHEFAHQLDSEKGYTNGAPQLGSRQRYESWSRVMSQAYAQLQTAAALGEYTLLNHYGATSEAEFFAVVTETFFEQPAELAAQHPALYAELRGYYCVDPLSW